MASDGGNILWPDPMTDSPTLGEAEVSDPRLGELEAVGGTYVRVPGAGIPAIGGAVMPSVGIDQRGATRDDMPDIGSVEAAAQCQP